MSSPRRPVLLLMLVALTAGVGGLCGAPAPASAGDDAPGGERPKLVDHPIKDAKPGEYLRYVQVDGQWRSFYIERVLNVRDGEVLWEVAKTNEDASKDLGQIRMGWVKIPELKPLPRQRVVTDKMVEMEIGTQKLWCRHFLVEEPVDPDVPERKRSKDVWYSNDVPCSGKVKDSVTKRIVTSWGQMPEDELKKRQEAYRKAQQAQESGEHSSE